MEILLWLVPSVAVTVVAMTWIGWAGREGRGDVDREAAVARLAAALERESPVRRGAEPRRPQDRSTGIAVRPSRRAGS